ncbi:pathogenesis-related leaf protein 4-like [Solanum dulcamara]|uniref:pathogenesis-related leaf protein 4-like n=1 Tax=Solanum dulcamara TaxID=45834 RepID=UPI0024852457|nr:pathogenesis-related leaf protein 4-like [Solanum dulcamara]
MGLFKNTLFLVCVMILAIIHSCVAQNSPQDYLSIHNYARDQVGVVPMSWDAGLETKAQNYANSRRGDCNLIHSGPGENLAKGSGDFTGRRAVQLWVAEKSDYNYASNQCNGGKMCGHYTQVVWRSSVRLGCGRARCNNGWWFICCNYAPPGNYIGQRPY